MRQSKRWGLRWFQTVPSLARECSVKQPSGNPTVGAAYRRVRPERTLGAVLAGEARGAGVLAEVVVPINGDPAEVAHLGATAARHAVAAFGFDQACRALVALPNAGSRHLLFSTTGIGKGRE